MKPPVPRIPAPPNKIIVVLGHVETKFSKQRKRAWWKIMKSKDPDQIKRYVDKYGI